MIVHIKIEGNSKMKFDQDFVSMFHQDFLPMSEVIFTAELPFHVALFAIETKLVFGYAI